MSEWTTRIGWAAFCYLVGFSGAVCGQLRADTSVTSLNGEWMLAMDPQNVGRATAPGSRRHRSTRPSRLLCRGLIRRVSRMSRVALVSDHCRAGKTA